MLLLVAQTLLVALTISYESNRAQEETEAVAGEVTAQIRHDLTGLMQTLQALAWANPPQPGWRPGAQALLRTKHELKRVEWRDPSMAVIDAVDTPLPPTLFSQMPRHELGLDTELACAAARRAMAPTFSRSFFVPLPGGQGLEVVDLCVPVSQAGRESGFLVGSFALAQVLQASLPTRESRRHEFSFVEGDGTRLARAGTPRGAGVYVAERVVDLPGAPLLLRADAAAGRPSLIPNLATALVIGMSIALFGVVLLLARDVRRRAQAERALAEALAFRSAMEDSLSTGLRARDLAGAITYVNPAFCAMVGFTREELRAQQPPYWPPEHTPEYQRRQRLRQQGAEAAHEGFETEFMRKNGERFPVMIYEAPLVDSQGRHTGWMSAVLDLSAQRRVEEISRQQQDRLQATARLATVGEMASLLSHELNQPLSAIASYASGSLNLLAAPEGATPGELRQALQRINEQAERAGRVIKSVHDFVRRRERLHETLGVNVLFDEVLPLVRMQARKSGTRIELDVPTAGTPVPRPPRVRCDRTMVEQVLLNLARNAVQAMETVTEPAERVLTLRARQTHPRWVTISVIDAGPGIAPDVAARLFTPFFTTKPEGMGLGLSLCRTVIEQHGGALDFGPGPLGRGAEFRFTLPSPGAPDAGAAEAGDAALAAAR
ncbi:ATP-binding protein [Brevundimonas sp.]|uniref:PAS domain-containing sensor histidine kinase n=1 Tax=Brevundimonas sp. TaxID=1871086 RepID=UPI002731EBB5|nr:ATP-binding protein [Brevundimonas sp.]MDP1912251.1 PAS domain S-box protein [Brevundimonas sp.]